MSGKTAGIDVHKKVLMVVMDWSRTGGEAGAAAIFHHAHRVAPSLDLAAGPRRGRGGDGIDAAILAIGVAGIGAVSESAFGAGIFQPGTARAEA